MKFLSKFFLAVLLLTVTAGSWGAQLFTAVTSLGSIDSLSSINLSGSEKVSSKPIQIADANVELEFWRSVKDSDDAEMLQTYLDIYPNGEFALLAKIRLK